MHSLYCNNYIILFFKFFFKFKSKLIFLKKLFGKKQFLKKVFKKRYMLFKKRFTEKVLISKRVSILLRRKSNQKTTRIGFKHKVKRFTNGNFFLKKYLFKTLLKSRLILKKVFEIKNRARQYKITRMLGHQKPLINATLSNILHCSYIFFFKQDVTHILNTGCVHVNGVVVQKKNFLIKPGDFIQIRVNGTLYSYIKLCWRFFKKKVKLHRYNAWKFFKNKQKGLVKTSRKRKNPKYLKSFYLYKFNTPTCLELDYKTLSICYLFKPNNDNVLNPYYFQKIISQRFFNLYNYKKIN